MRTAYHNASVQIIRVPQLNIIIIEIFITFIAVRTVHRYVASFYNTIINNVFHPQLQVFNIGNFKDNLKVFIIFDWYIFNKISNNFLTATWSQQYY